MVFEIVGREEELSSLQAFLDDGGRPAALVLEGEAGIGKSTLWEAGVEHARAQGLTVLSSRPAEAERALGHVGLGDLLEGVVDDVLSALLTPRRRALQVALLREEASGDPVDRRTLAVAVRDALQLLSERGPTLIAVDDVQWLDPSSSRALAFALRRLDASPVSLLLARRLVEGAQQSELERALGADRVRRVVVGPLSVGRAPSVPARSAGNVVRAPDVAPDPRAVGRESVLRAGAGPRSPCGRRPASAASGSRDGRRARAREDHGAPCVHSQRARTRRRRGHDVGVAAGARGRCRGRARPGGRRARDRARERDDPLHPPVAVVGPVRRTWARSGGAFTRVLRRSSKSRSSAPVTSRSRPTRRTPTLRVCSTTLPRWQPIAARRLSRPSSQSTRSG